MGKSPVLIALLLVLALASAQPLEAQKADLLVGFFEWANGVLQYLSTTSPAQFIASLFSGPPGDLAFTVPPELPLGYADQAYIGYSFCEPESATLSEGCGPGSTNPSGGYPPYKFYLTEFYPELGSDLLPDGMFLSQNGYLYGTPTGDYKDYYDLVVCANDNHKDVCVPTRLEIASLNRAVSVDTAECEIIGILDKDDTAPIHIMATGAATGPVGTALYLSYGTGELSGSGSVGCGAWTLIDKGYYMGLVNTMSLSGLTDPGTIMRMYADQKTSLASLDMIGLKPLPDGSLPVCYRAEGDQENTLWSVEFNQTGSINIPMVDNADYTAVVMFQDATSNATRDITCQDEAAGSGVTIRSVVPSGKCGKPGMITASGTAMGPVLTYLSAGWEDEDGGIQTAYTDMECSRWDDRDSWCERFGNHMAETEWTVTIGTTIPCGEKRKFTAFVDVPVAVESYSSYTPVKIDYERMKASQTVSFS